MALPNKPKGEIEAVDNPEIVEHKCDVLIVGGGMAACGAAFEIKKWAPDDMKIILVDSPRWSAPALLPRVFPPSTPILARMPSKTMSRWCVTT